MKMKSKHKMVVKVEQLKELLRQKVERRKLVEKIKKKVETKRKAEIKVEIKRKSDYHYYFNLSLIKIFIVIKY